MVTTKYKIDEKLSKIQSLMLRMAGLVEGSVADAADLLLKKQAEKKLFLKKLQKREEEINTLQLKISRAGLKVLARQSPVAGDLRFVLATLGANTDLERMGDLAFNIAQKAVVVPPAPQMPSTTYTLFHKMFTRTTQMVRGSLKAFIDKKPHKARSILVQDREVNRIRDRIRKALEKAAATHSQLIPHCMDLLIMARELERIADHTTNIAEEVIFLTTGDDIRHQKPKFQTPPRAGS